ncbi:MAG: tetratricopeptide repeat protein, partial [Elusimicrobiota bacterium]
FLLVTILPVLNIVYLTGRPLAEQRLYIPSLGFCMLTGYGFAQNWGKGVTKKLFMMLIAGYTIISFGRNFDWKDNVTFWSKTLTQAPSPRAYANLGEAYMKIEENELALRSLSEAIRMDPNCIEALSNLGIVYTKFGNYEKARFYFERCMELSPKDANQYVNLGVINLDNKELNKAIEIFKKGLIVNNKHPLLHYNLGNAYKKLGLLDKAIQEYKIAMVLNPDLKPAKINLESVLKQKGNKKRD